MAQSDRRRIDEAVARARFEDALATHHQDFQTFFLARLLGMTFEFLPADAPDADKEICRMAFEAHDFMCNPHGAVHGGVVAMALDIAMGHLVNKAAGPSATLEIKAQYLRALGLGPAVVEGRFLRRGRSVSFMESRLWDADGRLAATATATWKTARDKSSSDKTASDKSLSVMAWEPGPLETKT